MPDRLPVSASGERDDEVTPDGRNPRRRVFTETFAVALSSVIAALVGALAELSLGDEVRSISRVAELAWPIAAISLATVAIMTFVVYVRSRRAPATDAIRQLKQKTKAAYAEALRGSGLLRKDKGPHER